MADLIHDVIDTSKEKEENRNNMSQSELDDLGESGQKRHTELSVTNTKELDPFKKENREETLHMLPVSVPDTSQEQLLKAEVNSTKTSKL